MLQILTIFLLIFLAAVPVTSQIKFDEHEIFRSGENEGGLLYNFFIELNKYLGDSKGLVIIYTGPDNSGLGNVSGHLKGIKSWLIFRKIPDHKVSFVVTKGKSRLFKELWIIP